MICNLSGTQILLIIIGILILIWLINFLLKKWKSPANIIPVPSKLQPGVPILNPAMAPLQPGFSNFHPGIPNLQPGVPNLQPGVPNLNPSAGHIPIQIRPYKLYYFYSPQCIHCNNFNPVWDSLKNELRKFNNLSIHKIDGTNPNNANLVFYYGISDFPTIILEGPDSKIEYTGDRSLNDLYKFVVQNIFNQQRRLVSPQMN